MSRASDVLKKLNEEEATVDLIVEGKIKERTASLHDIMLGLVDLGSDLEQFTMDLKSVINGGEIDAGTDDDTDTDKLKDDAKKLLDHLQKALHSWSDISTLVKKLSWG